VLIPLLVDSVVRQERGKFLGMILVTAIVRWLVGLFIAIGLFLNGYLSVKARQNITNYVQSRYFTNKLYPYNPYSRTYYIDITNCCLFTTVLTILTKEFVQTFQTSQTNGQHSYLASKEKTLLESSLVSST
jgi:hypothetical protein